MTDWKELRQTFVIWTGLRTPEAQTELVHALMLSGGDIGTLAI